METGNFVYSGYENGFGALVPQSAATAKFDPAPDGHDDIAVAAPAPVGNPGTVRVFTGDGIGGLPA